jgi:hypothetical protein
VVVLVVVAVAVVVEFVDVVVVLDAVDVEVGGMTTVTMPVTYRPSRLGRPLTQPPGLSQVLGQACMAITL